MTKVRKKIGTIPINDIEQQVQQSTQAAVAQMQQDVTEFIDEETAQYPEIGGAFKFQKDPEERSEITTDDDGKIISYRKPNGVKTELVGVETTYLKVGRIETENVYSINTTTIAKDDTLYATRPKYGEIWFEGALPTDMSDNRTPTELSMTFKISGVPQFKCNCTLSIQGHGSAVYAKKGYTLEPYNSSWEPINIKFGDMIGIDSFHLKAYATDSLHCRDMANFNIWRDIIKGLDYPYSKMNNIPFEFVNYNKNKINTNDAKYAPDGFPCGCYINGDFLGLFTLKLKKSRQNYAMEKSVKSQIFMDALNGNGVLNTAFNPAGWNIKNPKMKNYEEGGQVPDAEVLANINRLFDWLSNIHVSTPGSYADYSDYVVLQHWLVFILFEELVFSEDIQNNNYNVVTWDATHWSIIPYDTDLSVGLHPWAAIAPFKSYWILTDEVDRFVTDWNQINIFVKFRNIFDSEIKQLYTKLRKDGFISPQNIVSYYIEQCKAIPRDIYAADYKKWGTIWNNGVPSIEQLYVFMNNRIAWLDTQWLISE